MNRPTKSPRTLIIAEAGVNHNGQLDLAKRLVEAAARSGADMVKFQTFNAKQLVTGDAPRAAYQSHATGSTKSQRSMLDSLEMSTEMHHRLIDHCNAMGIRFFSTGFDTHSVDFLCSLGSEIVKIPSGEITNLPYLRHIGGLGKQIILSTGMANLGEVEAALNVLERAGTPRAAIVVLHCTTEYPTPMRDVNLRAMVGMREAFQVAVGYSDHTPGIEVPIAAVALGACVIEKHLTLDRNLPGPDHKASLEPDELAAMVQAIRNIELALGDGIKRPSDSETKNICVARRSIVAAVEISAGEEFTEDNLTAKRPGNGISPMRWDEVIGRTASRHFARDELIDL